MTNPPRLIDEWGWVAHSNPPEVTPIKDTSAHLSGEKCWCHPFYDGDVLVHNAEDGREKYEKDSFYRKKPS
jgi:hypothetical protein